MSAPMQDARARFWARVERKGDNGCWEWAGSRFPSGYGTFWFQGKTMRAHRFSFWLAHGRWPVECCCHACDNKICVNPAHLFEGTHGDNARDRQAKGRGSDRRGERGGGHKLTLQDARDILANYTLCRVRQKDLAKRYGVTQMVISKITRKLAWVEAWPKTTEDDEAA